MFEPRITLNQRLPTESREKGIPWIFSLSPNGPCLELPNLLLWLETGPPEPLPSLAEKHHLLNSIPHMLKSIQLGTRVYEGNP